MQVKQLKISIQTGCYVYDLQQMNYPSKGIYPVRLCTQSERNYIDELYSKSEQKLREVNVGMDRINWRNLYVEGTHFLFKEQPQEQLRFQQFFNKFIGDLFPNVPLSITSIGFILNPKGSMQNQQYHFDVHNQNRGVFVPLVPLSSENATQFISFTPTSTPYDEAYYGVNDLDLLQRQGLDFYEVKQIVCKAYTVLRMEAGTVHRGIANRSDYDRPMLWAHAAPSKINLPQLEFENEDSYHIDK